MFCSQCGASNPDDHQYCARCGLLLNASAPASPTQSAATPPTLQGNAPTSGKAIASLILGLCSFIFPAAVAAIILGHISRSEIRKSAGRLKGSGMALTGLIFGYLGLAIIPLLIVAAIAIPNLLRARIVANEASAVGSIRKIVTAEQYYAKAYPQNGFACKLENLRDAESGHASLLDEYLTSGKKSGYTFSVECGEQDANTFRVLAYPNQPGSTGQRAFCADQTGVIRYSKDGSADTCLESGVPLT